MYQITRKVIDSIRNGRLYFSGFLCNSTHIIIEREIEFMKNSVNKLVLAAFFMALGIILPFLTGQIPQIGNKLLPMHIPILLCGFICGWKYGAAVGFVTPLLRSMLFGMPVMMPMAIGMAFELAAYGFMTGILHQILPKKNYSLYVSLLGAMVAGRIVWGIASIVLYGIQGNVFSAQIFLSGALLNAVPGIVLQIILIPAIMIALKRAGVLRNYETETV